MKEVSVPKLRHRRTLAKLSRLIGRRPLIGTALLEDYHLSIDFCEGGTVLVDEIL